jgi:hypothetical protein
LMIIYGHRSMDIERNVNIGNFFPQFHVRSLLFVSMKILSDGFILK